MAQADCNGNGAAHSAPCEFTVSEALTCLNNVEGAALTYLQAAAWRTGRVTVTAEEIAERTGYSASATKTALRNLIRQRLVKRVKGGLNGTASTWRVAAARPRRTSAVREQPTHAEPDRSHERGIPASRPRALPSWSEPPSTVNEMCDRFLEWAQSYYVRDDGTVTKERANSRAALKHLRDVAGDRPPDSLRAEDMYAVQQKLMSSNTCRGRPYTRSGINTIINRIRHVIKWATKPPQRWIPPGVLADVQLTEPLKKGRSLAPESKPVGPVSWEIVAQTLPHVSRQVRAMILVQWHSGARPGEVCIMRPRDIDQRGPVWVYRPSRHKTEHFGLDRVILLNHAAQQAIKPFLLGRDPYAFLFSPQESTAEFRARQEVNRTTPLKWGNRRGTNVKAEPRIQPRPAYDVQSYRQAVWRGCARAWPPPEYLRPRVLPGGKCETWAMFQARLDDDEREELKAWEIEHRWSPNRLRHAAATRWRSEYGLEAAQILLGHTHAQTTLIYAKRDLDKLMQLMMNGDNRSEPAA